MGIKKGDRISYFMENSPEMIISFYGILKSGAVPVPCNPRYVSEEMLERFNDSESIAVICDDDLYPVVKLAMSAPSLQHVITKSGIDETVSLHGIIAGQRASPCPPPEFNLDEDLALLPYTGGTTGVSKAAMLTHRNLVVNSLQFARWYQYREGAEIFISALPLSHLGGISGTMFVPISVAGTLILFRRFNPRGVLQAIQTYRASRFPGVPAMFIAILDQKESASYDLSSLTHSRTNAAPLPAAVKEAFDELVGHEVLVEGYGLTETSPLVLANPGQRPKAGSIGLPISDTDIRLVDPDSGQVVDQGEIGELVLRGPQLMKGYWKMPEETANVIRDGWFYTGDLARMDEDGYFYIVDRIKDMINVSGFKVWPREVEEVLYRHPSVKQAAVFGAPDPRRGERVQAVVVLKDGSDSSNAAQLRSDLMAFCSQILSAYKVPTVVDFRDDLPVDAAGKLPRRLLLELQSEVSGKR
jgi:long-chain acyl-CoA synthetase